MIIVSRRGPVRTANKLFSFESVKTFLMEHEGYGSRMTGGMQDGIRKGPVMVLQLLDRLQTQLLKNAHFVGRAMD